MEEINMINAVFIKTEFPDIDEDSQCSDDYGCTIEASQNRESVSGDSIKSDNDIQPNKCLEKPSIEVFIGHSSKSNKSRVEDSYKFMTVQDTEIEQIHPSVHNDDPVEKTRETIIQCCLCLKQFAHLSVLKAHISKHYSKVKVLCLICDQTISDEAKLITHMNAHFKERKFVCHSCGKTFRRSANLLRHELGCGKEKQSLEHLCTICGKLCQSKWQLQQHTMFHSDERPFPCTYCTKSFRFKARLLEHERTHLGIKPHSCDICRKNFTTSSDLRKHKKRHEKPGFKAYNTENNPNKLSVCKVCNANVVNLKNHMHMHYEKGSGTCNVCGKILKTKSLYQHLKIHLEGALYKCDICSRTFNRKDNMLSHRERHTKVGYKPKAIGHNDNVNEAYGQNLVL